MIKPYPLCFRPIYRDYLWGGNRIIAKYKRRKMLEVHAESWEICDRDDACSVVENGPFKGKNLRDVLSIWQEKLLGKKSFKFPLLVKIIDSKDILSVQVHPDEKAANKLKGEAKTECWYVLEAKKRAFFYVGLKKGLSKKGIQKAVVSDKCIDVINKVYVKSGDMIFIPAGCVHALGKGVLVLEVQQNSNTTYRLYDWGRKGLDGQARPLHIQEAMASLHLDAIGPFVKKRKLKKKGKDFALYGLIKCPYFTVDKLCVKSSLSLAMKKGNFSIFFIERGEGTLCYDNFKINLKEGKTILVPAYCKDIKLYNKSKSLDIIWIY
jgi:mannose-6-phosphate isomerase